MKALFIHDHIFRLYKDTYYSPGGLPSIVWERYLNHFKSLSVVSRGCKVNALSNSLTCASHDKVRFHLFYQVRGGLDYYRYRKTIKKVLLPLIQSHDFVILRLPSNIGFFASEICRDLGKCYIVEVVGCSWDSSWNYGTIFHKLIAPYNFFKTRKIVRNALSSIYVTQFFLQNRYPNINITNYASNVQLTDVSISNLNNHIDLIENSNGIINIGMIGDLNTKFKGYDIALKAMSILKRFNFVFHLVGGGDQTYIRSLVKKYNLEDKVNIIGRLQSGDKIFSFLDSLDIYIHPSKQEGLPRAVIEAMSRACPILASSVAGIPELIDLNWLHKPGDSEKLASHLKNFMNNKDLLKEQATLNFNKSLEYQQDVLNKRRFEFFESSIGLNR